MPIPSQDVFTTPVISDDVQLEQQSKINISNDAIYPTNANAVKLLEVVTNNNGKIRLYASVNSNIRVDDIVYIMYDQNNPSTDPTAIILDNYLEFSGCTDWMYLKQMQGYKVIETNESNNEITINRYYDSRLVGKKIYSHYISKIYIDKLIVTGGEVDGISAKTGNLNNSSDSAIDINVVQSIILSGSSFYIHMKNKYDEFYISTNSIVNTGYTTTTYKPYSYKGIDISNQDPTPSSSYYSRNNSTYGYNYVYNMVFRECKIDNGYFENCTFTDCILNGGFFGNSQVFNCEIYGGTFSETPIDINSTWINGTWSGGTFLPTIWYNGTWNAGDLGGIEWRNGVFNGGTITGSTWIKGIFQDGLMDYCTWIDGTFNGGVIQHSIWSGGTFNSGNMSDCSWKNGKCNGGELTNIINWENGYFGGGTITNSVWITGVFNNGNIVDSYWSGGTFNNGIFRSNNNVANITGGTVSYSITDKGWLTGTFNNGSFNNSVWSGGTWNGGNFENGSLWYNGVFKYGNMTNSYWLNGVFINGNVTSSYFHNVYWSGGTFNSGQLGVAINDVQPTIHWSGGTFNNGVFGNGSGTTSHVTNVYWYGGDFYGGKFYSWYDTCPPSVTYGGFYDGIFYDGYFYGTLFGGNWNNGTFGGCNTINILTSKIIRPPSTRIRPINKRYGEVGMNNQQNMLIG